MPDTLLKVRQPSSSSFVILKSYKALHWGVVGSGITTCGKKPPFLFSVTLHAALIQLVHFIVWWSNPSISGTTLINYTIHVILEESSFENHDQLIN